MKLKKIDDWYSIKPRYTTRNRAILEEFVASDATCCEVLDWKHSNAYSAQAALKASIDTYHIAGVTAIAKKGHVYLLKTM